MTWFDAENCTDTLTTYTIFESGTYEACITDVEVKDDQYGNEFIKVELTMPDHKKYFDNIYLSHPEYDKSKDRARMSLYCMLQGIGALKSPNDLKKLIGAMYNVEIRQYKQKTTGELRNAINGISAHVPEGTATTEVACEEDDVPLDGGTPVAQSPAPVVRAAPRAATPVSSGLRKSSGGLATPVLRR